MTQKSAEEPTEQTPPEDWPTLVRWLRGIPGLDQAELAAAAGVDPSTVSRYENGKLVPPRRTTDKLAAAVGVPSFLIEACLLPAIATVRGLSSRQESPEDLEEAVAALGRFLSDAARPQFAALLLDLARVEAKPAPTPPSTGDHAQAAELWERLEPCTPEEQEFLVESASEFHGWALAVRLAEESERAAAVDTGQALHLARLALRVVELTAVEPFFRFTLEGHVQTFFANALRVCSDLPGAEAAFLRAKQLVESGQRAGSDLLPAWRRLDLEASLRRDQRRWSEALGLLDLARTQGPPEAAGRILLKRSSVLVLMGEGERAVEVLREAAPLVDGRSDPRLLAVLRFNLAATLVLLGRHAAAEILLPEVRELALGLGNELDLVRCRWLEGQVAAGLGRIEEALAAFEEVLREFTAEEIAYDAALVALELAALYLEQGRTAEVKGLAEGMVWIFREQKVDAETEKALALFREAAAREAVTIELARRLAAHVTRARQQPGLAFEV